MENKIQKRSIILKRNKKFFLRYKICIGKMVFVFFCMCPFFSPIDIFNTDTQPYPIIIATIFVVIYLIQKDGNLIIPYNPTVVLAFSIVAALIIFCVGELNFSTLRGIVNYYSAFIITISWLLFLEKYEFPECEIKVMIILWFLVGLIQFCFDRTFLLEFISGDRWSLEFRGCNGLASEPSFYGIISFFFLHLIPRFRRNRILFFLLTYTMGVLFAQSAMGIIFLIVYSVGILIDKLDTIKGILILVVTVIAISVAVAFFVKFGHGSRLYYLLELFLSDGSRGLQSDESVAARLESITYSLQLAKAHVFLPQGFSERVGSLYGGILCELGVLGIPLIGVLTYGMAMLYKKKESQLIYFCLILLLFFSNSQLAHPTMWMVVAINYSMKNEEKDKEYDQA